MPIEPLSDPVFAHWRADPAADCALCREAGGVPVADALRWRVVRIADAAFPAFYRVIWNAHAAELTDLSPAERDECMAAVAAVERVLRERLRPDKVNLASFGNVVPHLHWHVVARFAWDSHYPQPLWGAAERPAVADAASRLGVTLEALDAAVRAGLLTPGAGG
jgi:diadenosine tetraphosphate (Ap4A) HIT family hydrolase